ncbi:MAG: hypothetical protein OER95_16190, partial [Acidimicrobiia bacterium]|nr:hypothetical protein [Acidimicrobiia bacterium]
AAERPFHCFADLGHGEVLLDGRKVVGLSQRRTRHWSRLQALAIRRWDGTAVNRLLTPMLRLPSIESLGRPPYDANQVAAGPGPGVTLARGPDLIRSLLGRLPPIERLD